jgi:protein-disulfide isomerase
MTTAAPDSIEGTPGFFINGKQAMGVFTWDKLLPLLRAGGAR